jgi:hypothetical protein
MQLLYQRFTPGGPIISHVALPDAVREQGIFLLGNGGF